MKVPWITRVRLDEMQDSLQAMEVELVKLRAQLDAETSRRERVELEYSRLNDDFRGLIALTAGRVPPKLAPEFDRDIFAEDTAQPVTFLSPDPDDPAVDAEAILRALDDGRSEESDLSG